MSGNGLKLTAIAGTKSGPSMTIVIYDGEHHVGTVYTQWGKYADRILSLLNGEAAQEPAKGPVRTPGQPISPDAGDSTPGTETGDE